MTESARHVSVLIVGNTLEAWLAAAYLSRVFGKTGRSIGIVPAGPAGASGEVVVALPEAVDLHAALGFDERDMLRFCGGCFRLGTEFENWSADGGSFIHAYGAAPPSPGEGAFHQYWNRLHGEVRAEPYHRFSFAAELTAADRFAHPPQGDSPKHQYRYGYHLDAGRYREYLKRAATHYGTNIISGGDIAPSTSADSTRLAGLGLSGGQLVTADIYVDATGDGCLAGALAGLDWQLDATSPFDAIYSVRGASTVLSRERIVAQSDSLLIETPAAHDLYRSLVFSAGKVSRVDAESRLGAGGTYAEFRQGHRDPWKTNCLAIGPSAFQLLPLEGASLQMAMLGILRFAELLPDVGAETVASAEYNRRMMMAYNRLRDAQEMHFALARQPWSVLEYQLSPENTVRLEQFRSRGRVVTFDDETFSPENWVSIMLGHGVYPRRIDPIAATLPIEDVGHRLQGLRAHIQKICESIPPQRAYLEQAKAIAPRRARSLA